MTYHSSSKNTLEISQSRKPKAPVLDFKNRCIHLQRLRQNVSQIKVIPFMGVLTS